ncbi:SH3 domain-binding protein 2-like [Littorina saxatilis]|uniref:Uncharacterized protein n=1 Tax=Littorina saxatilis TaxID=31220 RepID=A0AAN9BQJ4_9CAEN
MADENLYSIAPSPNKTIGCQDLLKDGACIHSGWLRRQSLRNRFKIFSWPQVYVVVSGGCVYCYKNETAIRQACAFSLYGYNAIFRAGEVTQREAPWAFKVVHVNHDFRSYLFSSSSEREMMQWMKLFKQEMLRANGKLTRTQGDGFDSANPMYQDAGSSDTVSIKSQDYTDIECNIYEDSAVFTLPQDYTNKKEDDASDDEMTELVLARPDLQERPPLPPPVPKRPSKHPSGGAATPKASAVVSELEQRNAGQDQFYTTPPTNERLQKPSEEPKVDRDAKPSSLRKRGDPDGSSLKKTDEQPDARDFWSSIFFYGGKDQAGEIIRQLADDGVYLVRVNDDKSMVLHVFAKEQPRKFQVFKQDNMYTLKKVSGEPFKRVEELIYYYYSNPLPNVEVCLTDCYLHHPDFDSVSLS